MTDDLLNAYRREAADDARTITALRAEVARLTAELAQAKSDAVAMLRSWEVGVTETTVTDRRRIRGHESEGK